MTRRVPTGTGAAVLTAVLLGALTGCGSDGPDALEKELGRKCQGRVAADSVDVRLAEGVTAEVVSTWHQDGHGQCWVNARGRNSFFEPFALEVTAAADAAGAEKVRRELCSTIRADADAYLLYTGSRDHCSAYSLKSGEYVAHGAVGRYNASIHILGVRPVDGVDAPQKKAREEFERVMGDLREHYRR
ncbi:hypothetical protein [Streptomyces olivaceoviridis]|uniref:hypothetical protein n=1 Tax=Streptomyces olivaceoviridis TaxID=1921 RepID=UPI0033AE9A3D